MRGLLTEEGVRHEYMEGNSINIIVQRCDRSAKRSILHWTSRPEIRRSAP